MTAAPFSFGRLSRVASTLAVVLATAFAIAAALPAQASAGIGAPSISSDRPDYAPGDTVYLTGEGWDIGEVVHINVNDGEGQTWSRDVDVTADFFGNVADQFLLPSWFVSAYSVTATGPSGTATATFTDANLKVRGFFGTGVSDTYLLTYTRWSATGCAGTKRSGDPDTLLVGTADTTVPPGGQNSVTLSAPATSAGGRAFLNWTNPDGTLASSNATFCADFPPGGTDKAYVANYAANSPPSVARNSATVTVAEGQAAANTGTWSDANSGDTVTLTASVGTVTKAGTNASGTWSWSFSTTDGPNQSQTVTITADDGHGGVSTTTFALTVNNVAPTATFPASRTVNEGSSSSFAFTSPSDPSSADTGAGFHYAFSCTGASLAGATYAGSGSASSVSCGFDDGPASPTVRARIIDKDGGFSEYTTAVTVDNVAPTAAFSNNGPVDEGSSFTLSLSGGDDVSAADKAAKFEFAFDCGDGSGYGAWSSAPALADSRVCATDDNGSRAVKAKIRDKDGGVREYSDSVSVTNVAPTASFSNDGPVDEGSSFTLSMSDGDDVSSADKAAKFEFAFDCGDGSGYGAWSSPASLSGTRVCGTSDNGTRSVKAKVRDKDGGVREYTDSVTVRNVAPSATLNAPDEVNEGSDIALSLTSVSDPGSSDTHQFRFSCDGGTTWTSYGAADSASCPTTDNGTRTVKGQVRDDDGGESSEYSKNVTVKNVAPSATFNAPDEVSEGSDIDLSLTNVQDLGSADTHQYRFSCDGGSIWSAYGAADSAVCPTTDNGTRTVKGQVRDDDGGESSEYSKDVTVKNVAPTATFNAPDEVDEGSDINISLTGVEDPGSADTHQFRFSCDGGSTWSAYGAADSASCSTADNGTRTVKGQARDDDGGESAVYSKDVTVKNVAPTATFNAPDEVDEGSDINVSLTGVQDSGSADTHEFRFSCDGGSTWSAYGGSNSASCSTGDNGTKTVKGQVRDDDGGESAVYSKDVTVKNVAPSATFSNDGPVDEGSSFTLSMSDGDDVSSADKAAKFEFAFDCGDGSGYGVWSSPASLSQSRVCATDDNGTRSVKAKVRDKDGGVREYSDAVTVKNVAPAATFNAPDEVDEGSDINLSLTSVQDPGSADTHQYRFSCDGGANWTSYGASNSASCPTIDNGTKTVKGQVRDDDGGESAVYSKDVTVKNVAPSATFNAPDEVDEGSDVALSLTGVQDPGAADTHQFRFSCDGGSNWTSYGASNSASCPTADNGTKTVKGQVRDDDGGESAVYSKDVTVKNVAPTATFSNNGPVDEGSSFTLTMANGDDVSAADKAAKFEFAFDCGDGTGYSAWSSPASLSDSRVCATTDNGTRAVKARIRDKDGGVREYTDSVTVRNVAPTATFNAPSSVTEGQNINLSLTSPGDPSSADSAAGFTYAFDCGDGAGYGVYSASNTKSCSTSDNGTRTVKGKIRDKDGGYTEYTKTVSVSNGAPQVTVVSPSFGALYAKPATVAMNASFTDSGTSDTHTCSFNWDDGASSSGAVTEASGSGNCTGTHTYSSAGVFTVKVTVTDDDGASTTVEWMVVVYDPNAGFITGGGWIDVAPGSYAGNPSLSGRANFGFNSQYKKGATVPTGETEFNFQVADFKFHSSQYDYLVVSGYKAQYKGTGEVNGVPGYSFRLTAYDGDLMNPKGPDKFRIKISGPSGVVFDNRTGKADDLDVADPQVISGGSIVIHKA